MTTLSDEMTAWVERVLGLATAPGTPDGKGGAMAGWTAARATAMASLKALENAYRGMKHPLSDPAIILLRAIQGNLTAEPATPAQVRELTAYLTGDSIITDAETPNGFGFQVSLRVPLLAALEGLRKAQAAGRANA